MVRKKRKAATQLVKESIPAKSGMPWFEQLSATDRLYVRNVVLEMIENPEAALTTVAQGLIFELSINRSVTTIARTLREMIRDAQQKA